MIQIFALMLFFRMAWGAPPQPESFAGRSEMNGYRLTDFKDFDKKWKLVTVRYRKDTGEMRFVYANELAWQTLEKHQSNFTDGSVFAKISTSTAEDPAFASSVVPGGNRRYQLMVRDEKRHADTRGWGYAVFDVNGLTFPEDPHTASQACAACHHLVPQRGEVFSQIMDISPFSDFLQTSAAPSQRIDSGLTFVDELASQLPGPVQRWLPVGTKHVRVLKGPLTESPFQGSLDEIQPFLAKEVARSGQPALLLSSDQQRFSLVVTTSNKKCAKGKFLAMRGLRSLNGKGAKPIETLFCEDHP